MGNQDTCWMSASDLAEAIRAKELSPVEVVKNLLDRIEAINPQINAYVTVTADSAMAAARKAEDAVMRGEELGVLHGVPFSVKDTTFTKGVRTTMGSRLLENFVPEEDAVNVSRLKKAGAIMVGKTNTPEFACKAVTENLVFGTTCNPWNLKRTTGGSSGGAAAAVSAGLGPLATCNDAGGSIRIPASCCGVFGMKPQFGRVPNYPFFHLWESMFHEGTMTRTVKDATLMLDAMMGYHWGDRHSLLPPHISYVKSLKSDVRGLRVAWSLDLGYATVSQQVRSICEEAVKIFSEMGAEVEEATPDLENVENTYTTIINAELGAMLSSFGPINKIKDKLHPFLSARIASIQNLMAIDYLRATFARRELSAKVGKFFEIYDLLLTPTIGIPAWPIGLPTGYVEEVDGKKISGVGWLLAHPFNLTGQPAASIPVGWTEDGLPVGLQIVSRHYDEATVFRAALAFEKGSPWIHRKPPLD
jgi:aspartyl-tRNA(Asn)/glutamyl-tRNA(Gln) amidotransferase subunit A